MLRKIWNPNEIIKRNFFWVFRKQKSQEIEPVRLAYTTYKDILDDSKSPLVVIHGLFGSKSNWRSMCKAFNAKTRRKIIAVDARNHGESPHSSLHSYDHISADIKCLIDDLNIPKVSLLGHSMGGRGVMRFALQYPEIVDKLILADISPINIGIELSEMPDLMKKLEDVSVPPEIQSLSQARILADEQLSKSDINDKSLRAFLLSNLIQKENGSIVWRMNLPVLKDNLDLITQFPYESGSTFKGPTLFVGGGNSDFIRKSDHPDILKIFPNAKIEYIEGAGHWVHSEKPNEFLKLTVDFLN